MLPTTERVLVTLDALITWMFEAMPAILAVAALIDAVTIVVIFLIVRGREN